MIPNIPPMPKTEMEVNPVLGSIIQRELRYQVQKVTNKENTNLEDGMECSYEEYWNKWGKMDPSHPCPWSEYAGITQPLTIKPLSSFEI